MYTEQDGDEEDSEITIRIEAEGGFLEGIYDTNGTRIGALYQNVIYDANSNTRIGMNQGYSYSFPNESYIQIDLGYSYGLLSNANRRFIFDNGDSMDIFNEIVCTWYWTICKVYWIGIAREFLLPRIHMLARLRWCHLVLHHHQRMT